VAYWALACSVHTRVKAFAPEFVRNGGDFPRWFFAPVGRALLAARGDANPPVSGDFDEARKGWPGGQPRTRGSALLRHVFDHAPHSGKPQTVLTLLRALWALLAGGLPIRRRLTSCPTKNRRGLRGSRLIVVLWKASAASRDKATRRRCVRRSSCAWYPWPSRAPRERNCARKAG
jgi:hypothetical protein